MCVLGTHLSPCFCGEHFADWVISIAKVFLSNGKLAVSFKTFWFKDPQVYFKRLNALNKCINGPEKHVCGLEIFCLTCENIWTLV